MGWRKDKIALSTNVCVGLFYTTPLNSEWFKANFIRDLRDNLIGKYSNGEFLIMGDYNCRIEERQTELCAFLMSGKNGILKAIILAMKDLARSKIVMQKEIRCQVFVQVAIPKF
jgi:hypothetical protein